MTRGRFKFGGKMRADVVVLIPNFNGNRSFHIFDALHPVFYQRSGAVKSIVSWNPAVTKTRTYRHETFQSMTTALMSDHLNNWSMIETKRVAFSHALQRNAA